jgi:uncharacterized membrane protein
MIHTLTLIVLPLVLALLLGVILVLKRYARTDPHGAPLGESGFTVEGFSYALIVLAVLYALGVGYFFVRGTPWEAHLLEWLNIVVRLMHITFGIAWIGASFYFVFLENALNRTHEVRDELAGNLWAVHGGGFYYLEKYKVAPKIIPRELHWFKYEAYFTWLTGFSLLVVVYYFNASGMLIDPQVMPLSTTAAVSLGVGSFAAAWVIYDQLCKTPLIRHQAWFGLLGLLILGGFAWGYCQVFSARAAYLHFGAMIGTLMVGNVFFVIIPGQKAMVKAALEGRPVDPSYGKKSLARSLHNNYFTLPVLFVMVSNHFPSTFGHAHPWAILLAITIGTAGVKHWLNLREKKQESGWVLPLSAALLLGVAFVTAPKADAGAANLANAKPVHIEQVVSIVQARCIQCHSSNPTDDVFKTAPNGVKYDTPQDIIRLKDKILQRVVITKTMPQNNKTHITQEERDLIGAWIAQGARGE